MSAGVEDPDPDSEHNTFFKNLTLEQGKAILSALDLIASHGEQALEELVADSGYFMKSVGLDRVTPKLSKNIRFSILPFKAALLCNSGAVIVPVVHYVSADPEGRYVKGADGALPPVEWKIKYLALPNSGVDQVLAASKGLATPFDLDLVMFSDGSIGRINKQARWKLTPELASEIEKAAMESSNILELKLLGRPGVRLLQDFLEIGPQLLSVRGAEHFFKPEQP